MAFSSRGTGPLARAVRRRVGRTPRLAAPDRDAGLAAEIQRVEQRYAAAATATTARMPTARFAGAGSATEETRSS